MLQDHPESTPERHALVTWTCVTLSFLFFFLSYIKQNIRHINKSWWFLLRYIFNVSKMYFPSSIFLSWSFILNTFLIPVFLQRNGNEISTQKVHVFKSTINMFIWNTLDLLTRFHCWRSPSAPPFILLQPLSLEVLKETLLLAKHSDVTKTESIETKN